MKILLISNSIIEYDGRLRELVKIAKGIGDTYYISRALPSSENEKFHYVFSSSGLFSYIKFVRYCLRVARNINNNDPIDVIFADNRKAIFPAILIRNIMKIKHAIYDSRELYLLKESKSISNFVGCLLERLFINKFDVVVCANSQRSKIMKDLFDLKSVPLVYENIRKLNFSTEIINMQVYEQKYKEIFTDGSFVIIATDGFSKARGTDKLIEAIKKLGKKYSLVLAGKITEQDKNKLNEISERYKNIYIVGLLSEQELKYVLNKCNIGFVSYPMDTYNNIYCASGKVYEFLFEGLPVLTSKNPPLLELCEKYKVGISTEDFLSAILEISVNYDFYKNNVFDMQKTVSVEYNNNILLKQLKNSLYMLNNDDL